MAAAFGISYRRIAGETWQQQLSQALDQRGPLIVEAMLDPEQGFEPKIAAKKLPDGRMVSLPPEDMFPFLDRAQLQSHLLFPLENPEANDAGDGANFDCAEDEEPCKTCPFLRACPRWSR